MSVIITRMEQPVETVEDVLADAAEQIRQYGNHAGRFSFAGVRVQDEGLVVYRVPNPGFDDEVRALLGDVPVEIVDAVHSRAELMIAREAAWTVRGGFEVESVVLPDDGSRVRVFVAGSTWDAQEALDREVPGCVEIIPSRRNVEAMAPVPVAVDRRSAPR